MTERRYSGPERRKFVRLEFEEPLDYKICKKETIDMLLHGYTSDVSKTGILCKIKNKVNEGDVLWLSFNRQTLNICQEIEKNSLIYQNGIIGKVVRVDNRVNSTFDVGVQFITREEKDTSSIFSKINLIDEKHKTK